MRLNSAPLNARGVNAAVRLPVTLEAAAPIVLAPEFDATRIAVGSGSAVAAFAAAFTPTAQRFGAGDAAILVATDVTPQVARMGGGAAVLQFSGALYFARTVYGSGELALVMDARGDVGVKFGEGAAVLLPFQAELDGARTHQGAGAAAIEVAMDFTASAIRRPEAGSAVLLASVEGALDPSHITGGGVRYVGMFGELPVAFSAIDDGMNRQANIGTLELVVVSGIGTATVLRPTLAGSAVSAIVAEAQFIATRRGEGRATITAIAECDGAIFVQGAGSLPLALSASGYGSVTRMAGLTPALVSVGAEGVFVRGKAGRGEVVITIGLSGTGTRKRRMAGSFVIQALSFGDGITNPDAEDIDRQTFARSDIGRQFAKPATQKEFVR